MMTFRFMIFNKLWGKSEYENTTSLEILRAINVG